MIYSSIKRIAAAILLAASVVLAGCSGSESSSENVIAETSAGASSETAAVEKEPTVTETVRAMFGDKNYDGREFRILTPDPGGHFYYIITENTNEIWYEQENGEIMNDAIVSRNRSTEELLNIKVVPVWGTTDTNTISSTVKKSVAAGSDDFDIVITRMDFYGPLMKNGCLANLKSINSIDTSHSWWDKNIVESFTLFDSKLFWISGDINFLDDYAAEVIFFNKVLCDNLGFEAPYQSVRDGSWVIDDMYTMSKAAERDIDGDGKMTPQVDIVGHTESNDHIKHWIYAMGEKSIDISNTGDLVINTLSERQVNAVDKLYRLMVEGEMTYTSKPEEAFAAGLSLFQGDMLGSVSKLRDMENDFGIIPPPKYDENQENYGTYVSNGWTTALAVPMTCSDREFTGTAFEVMCGMSTDTVRSAVYDVLLSSKLIRDEETVEMLDIIFRSKSYDWAVDFEWGSTFQGAYNGIYTSKNNNYVSAAEKAYEKQMTTINQLLETIQSLPD